METKKAIKWVGIWIGLAMLFNFGIYLRFGQQKAVEFFGGYIIEQSLSLDNLFLFILVFSSFGISEKYQRRVLNYGIIGAIILRLIFVVLGVAVVSKFEWVLYIFGAILIVSGIKMMKGEDEDNKDFNDNFVMKLLKKIIPITEELDGEKFFVRKNKVLYATPLLAILIIIESTDIIFAIDSIPAIFSITVDPFIVYTSNIFAILGLRSLYFLLLKVNDSFEYVKYGVALILMFTGIKMLITIFKVHITVALSVGIIFTILIASILISVMLTGRKAKEEEVTDEAV
jgi:tellurite resistance protein TerC